MIVLGDDNTLFLFMPTNLLSLSRHALSISLFLSFSVSLYLVSPGHGLDDVTQGGVAVVVEGRFDHTTLHPCAHTLQPYLVSLGHALDDVT
jgi:hypothetical protein